MYYDFSMSQKKRKLPHWLRPHPYPTLVTLSDDIIKRIVKTSIDTSPKDTMVSLGGKIRMAIPQRLVSGTKESRQCKFCDQYTLGKLSTSSCYRCGGWSCNSCDNVTHIKCQCDTEQCRICKDCKDSVSTYTCRECDHILCEYCETCHHSGEVYVYCEDCITL